MDEPLNEATCPRLDHAKRNIPYGSEEEHIRELMALVSLYLICAVSRKADCAEAVRTEEDAQNLPGTAMGFEEAACHVADYSSLPPPPEPEIPQLIAAARAHIDGRLAASKASGFVPRPQRLRELLGLSDFEYFCLACALASALDRGFERLFVSLHGNLELLVPTLGAVFSVYGLIHETGLSEAAVIRDPDSAASRLLFRAEEADLPFMQRPLALRSYVEEYLVCGGGAGGLLRLGCSLIKPGDDCPEPLFLERQVKVAGAVVEQMAARDKSLLLVLCGRAGSGRRATLRLIAGQKGMGFLTVPLDERNGEASPEQWTGCIEFLALTQGMIPCFILRERPAGYPWLRQTLAALERSRIGAVLLAEELRASFCPTGRAVVRVDYPMPSLSQSLAVWEYFSERQDVKADCGLMAAKYSLTPGRIEAALESARLTTAAQGGTVTSNVIDAAVLAGNTGRLGEIAERIEARYSWEDLVLSEAALGMLQNVCNRIKNRHIVETRWGLGRAYGNGVSVLLYGPPGTGKTMSAQVLAGELGLPLYRINLAQIVSKYIGETAKNLDAVFTEAKASNVVLFFDEADALFAKRTDVKNSNDRHANSESSYLLQKVEEYSGVSILATNLANNFDEAFRRRIQYMINIGLPNIDQRLALWKGTLPSKVLAPGVDFELLSRELEFSGSVIASAATQAAYFAAEEGGLVSMSHLVRAVRLELQKLGKSEPHGLGAYM